MYLDGISIATICKLSKVHGLDLYRRRRRPMQYTVIFYTEQLFVSIASSGYSKSKEDNDKGKNARLRKIGHCDDQLLNLETER